jgi:hypothetical protein
VCEKITTAAPTLLGSPAEHPPGVEAKVTGEVASAVHRCKAQVALKSFPGCASHEASSLHLDVCHASGVRSSPSAATTTTRESSGAQLGSWSDSSLSSAAIRIAQPGRNPVLMLERGMVFSETGSRPLLNASLLPDPKGWGRRRSGGGSSLHTASDFLREILWLARNFGFGGRRKEVTSGEVFADDRTVGGGTQSPARRE